MRQILILTSVVILFCNCTSNQSKPVNKLTDKPAFDTAGYSLNIIDDLHERLTLKDYDENLFDYTSSNPTRVDSTRKVIYILPFGNMKPEVEKIVKEEVEYLQAFFQLDVKVMDRIPYDSIKKLSSVQTRMVPNYDFEYYSKMKGGTPTLTEQIQCSSFMNIVLKSRKPKDAIALLGITEHDIYDSGYNFLFGMSELKSGVGLVSTFRLIDYGQETKLNIRKVVSKQIVNMFSISNVKDFKCVLNFHINIDEVCRGKLQLSPRALEKLKYAIGFDYSKRFGDLAKYWTRENNKEERKYYEECVRRMGSASR